jgi:protein O-GlcNAcase/histone acetyltransferase
MVANPFMCGVVEGFYGRPWTAAQRRQLFAWMREWKLNTYLYAPKDDLKHRTQWRELYTPSEARDLKTLMEDSRSKGIRFFYAISPGADGLPSSESDAASLDRKARQLLDIGCENFAILFDDITTDPMDGPVESVETAVIRPQVQAAHTLLSCVRARAPAATLLFCPTQYCERMAGSIRDSVYLRLLGERLDPAIPVFWTGPEIVSEKITPESMRELGAVLHRKPIIWDNLHANDYDMRRLYLGPYAGRPLELREEVSGVLSNPNCEFEANFVPLCTLALWQQAQKKWEPRPAYLAALKEWLPAWELQSSSTQGDVPFTIADLELLADCFYLPYEHGPRASDLLARFQYLMQAPPTEWGSDYSLFLKMCLDLQLLFVRVMGLRQRDLLYALYRYVWELKEEVDLLLKYLSWLQSKPTFGEAFISTEHRPKTYRGGLVAELQRLLPMDEAGGFSASPSLLSKHDPDPHR